MMSRPIEVPTNRFSKGASGTLRSRLAELPLTLRSLALAALTVALFDPHVDRSRPGPGSAGLDIFLLIDASLSMRAQDLRPDRLAAAVRLATSFVQSRPRDRFGVISFAGDAVLECPITIDRSAIVESLAQITTIDRSGGTALGQAVAAAVARLRHVDRDHRVVIVLTDGATNVGDPGPQEAAALASAYGVRAYTIGIGARGNAPYPTEFGTMSIPLDLDESVLRDLARRTAGTYIRAADVSALSAAFSDLNRREPADRTVPVRIERVPLAAFIVSLALFMLLCEQAVEVIFLQTVTP